MEELLHSFHLLLNKDLHMQVHEVCFIFLHVLFTMVYFSSLVFKTGFMFNMTPEKFSEIAENLDPDKPLQVSQALW